MFELRRKTRTEQPGVRKCKKQRTVLPHEREPVKAVANRIEWRPNGANSARYMRGAGSPCG